MCVLGVARLHLLHSASPCTLPDMASSSSFEVARAAADGGNGTYSGAHAPSPDRTASAARSGRAVVPPGAAAVIPSFDSLPGVRLPERESRKRAVSGRPASDPADSDSTEYVPVAERGWRGAPPVVDDAAVQPHRHLKKRRRLALEAAARRVRLLGARLLQAYGRAAVDAGWEAALAVQGGGTASLPHVFLPERESRKRSASHCPASDPVDSDSTEYVPVAERGWRGAAPAVDDGDVQPHRHLKRRRRLAREAAARRVRFLGERLLEAYGRAAVEAYWDATAAVLDGASLASAASPAFAAA